MDDMFQMDLFTFAAEQPQVEVGFGNELIAGKVDEIIDFEGEPNPEEKLKSECVESGDAPLVLLPLYHQAKSRLTRGFLAKEQDVLNKINYLIKLENEKWLLTLDFTDL